MSSSGLSTSLALGFWRCKRAIVSTVSQGLTPQCCHLHGEKKPSLFDEVLLLWLCCHHINAPFCTTIIFDIARPQSRALVRRDRCWPAVKAKKYYTKIISLPAMSMPLWRNRHSACC
jgi:hypothetical protein